MPIRKFEEVIIRSGFQVNTSKTRLMCRGHSQFVTGLNVTDSRHPRIPRRIKRRIRMEVYQIKKYGLESFAKHRLGIVSQKLSDHDQKRIASFCSEYRMNLWGWIVYIQGIEPIIANVWKKKLSQ